MAQVKKGSRLTCRWCGETYEGLSSIDHTDAGFWCDMCDGFTHFHETAATRHRMLLLLEKGGLASNVAIPKGEIPRPKKLGKWLSPLRYPGGKSKLIDLLHAQLLSGHTDTFVEVFAGGASLGLSLLDAGCVNTLVLNDYDPLVYAFWKVCLYSPESLCARITDHTPTLEDFWNAKATVRKHTEGENISDEDLAWAFFLLNRTCFSGIISANPMGGKRGGEGFLARWNANALIKRIRKIGELAPQIKLCNKDCNSFLEEEAYWLQNCTLFIDPPYVEKGAALYPSSFKVEDHERLAWLLNSLYTGMDGPDIIITYDDHPLVRDLYPFAEVRTIARTYSIAN